MTREEFQNLTGITVDLDEYEAIEQIYYADANLPKEAFCKWFKTAADANGYSLIIAAGNKLLTNERDLREAKHERDELAIFIAEQAEESSSSVLRKKAIEMMGERQYISWKIENGKRLWKLDLELIKELINQ